MQRALPLLVEFFIEFWQLAYPHRSKILIDFRQLAHPTSRRLPLVSGNYSSVPTLQYSSIFINFCNWHFHCSSIFIDFWQPAFPPLVDFHRFLATSTSHFWSIIIVFGQLAFPLYSTHRFSSVFATGASTARQFSSYFSNQHSHCSSIFINFWQANNKVPRVYQPEEEDNLTGFRGP